MSGANTLLDGLNAEQLAAVTAKNEGSTLVLAGAGCGKTSVLTRRIAFLVKNGITPERICALTFSRKAADEMFERLHTLEPRCKNATTVTTFHAFALKVLQEKTCGVANFEKIGFTHIPKLIDANKRLEMLSRITTAPLRNALRMNIFEIDNALCVLALFPEKAHKKYGANNVNLLTKINDEFYTLRKQNGLFDFSDLINGCRKLFREFPNIAEIFANRFDAVLVDEFQDTDPAQIEILETLIARNAALYAVGDDDQAIYGFRGADIRPIMNFAARFKNAKIIKLQINYRSAQPILNYANKLWANKDAAYRKVLVCGLPDMQNASFKPQAKRFDTHENALAWIHDSARKISKQENIPINDMAILFRLNDTLNTSAKFYANMNLQTSDTPQLLTIHASKGLEYPVVFLCDLEEGIFPHYKLPPKKQITTWRDFFAALVKPKTATLDPLCDFDEELRLFYVGITRARRFLFLIHSAKKTFHDKTTKFTPSRFLQAAT